MEKGLYITLLNVGYTDGNELYITLLNVGYTDGQGAVHILHG